MQRNPTIAESVNNLYTKMYLTYYSKQKKYLVNGILMSKEAVDKLYPVHLPVVTSSSRKWKGETPDKTKIPH
jgi:restriction endonuclease